MYPVFGVRGACLVLGVQKTFGALIFIGFWEQAAGVLGALGGIASFVCFHWIPRASPSAATSSEMPTAEDTLRRVV